MTTACTTGRCRVDGGEIAYAIRGAGPALVLLHGFTFDRRAWDAQMAAFSEGYRVLRYDLRGFGESSVPAGPYSHSDDLRTLLETLGLEHPILVGLSLGANVALEYALRFPGEIRALVLASPGLVGHRWTELRPPDAAAAHAHLHGIDSAKRFWLDHPLFDSLKRHPDAHARLQDMVAEYSGWHWRHANPVTSINVTNRLHECRVPTLVVSGDLDVAGYRSIAGKIAAEIPGAQLLRLADAGHIVNDDGGEFTAAVLGFVAP